MTFDLIVFDWDGTLMDSTAHVALAIQKTCRAFDLTIPDTERAKQLIGLNEPAILQILYPNAQAEQQLAFKRQLSQYLYTPQQQVHLFPNTHACLEAIKQRGTLMAVATGNSRSGLNHLLEKSQLGSYFAATRTVSECRGKPDAQMLIEIMDVFSIPPEHTLMIGDTHYDLEMAKNAGCHSVGMGYGAHTESCLERYHPLAVFHSMSALQDWLLPKLSAV